MARDKIIEMFTLPRSGSNYLKALIDFNSPTRVSQNRSFWKHDIYILDLLEDIDTSNIIIITPIKSCEEWLSSMHRFMCKDIHIDHPNPWIYTPEEDFYKWVENPIGPRGHWKTPIHMYEWFLTTALKVKESHDLRAVLYDDILNIPEEAVKKLLPEVNWNSSFLKITNRVNPSAETPIVAKTKFERLESHPYTTPDFSEKINILCQR